MAISSSAGTGVGAGVALGVALDDLALASGFVMVGFSDFVSFFAFFGGVDVLVAAALGCQ